MSRNTSSSARRLVRSARKFLVRSVIGNRVRNRTARAFYRNSRGIDELLSTIPSNVKLFPTPIIKNISNKYLIIVAPNGQPYVAIRNTTRHSSPTTRSARSLAI